MNKKKFQKWVKRHQRPLKKVIRQIKKEVPVYRDTCSMYLKRIARLLKCYLIKSKGHARQIQLKVRDVAACYLFKVRLYYFKTKCKYDCYIHFYAQKKEKYIYNLICLSQNRYFIKFVNNSQRVPLVEFINYSKKTRKAIFKCKLSLWYKNFRYGFRRFIKKKSSPDIY